MSDHVFECQMCGNDFDENQRISLNMEDEEYSYQYDNEIGGLSNE